MSAGPSGSSGQRRRCSGGRRAPRDAPRDPCRGRGHAHRGVWSRGSYDLGEPDLSIVSEQTARRLLAAPAPSRALRVLPLTLLVLDLVLIAAAGGVAVLGRESLMPFGSTSGALRESVGMIGPLMLLGWLGADRRPRRVPRRGARSRDGRVQAGPERRPHLRRYHRRRVLRAPVPALAGVLPARLRPRGPGAARRPLRHASGAPGRTPTRRADAERPDRRHPLPRRRRGQGAQPRELARVPGRRRADPGVRPQRGDRARSARARQRRGRARRGEGARRRRHLLRRRVGRLGAGDATDVLDPRAAAGQGRRRAQRHRHLQRARVRPPRRRPAADPRRPADLVRRLPLGQAALRRRRRSRADPAVRPGHARDRRVDQARPTAGRCSSGSSGSVGRARRSRA